MLLLFTSKKFLFEIWKTIESAAFLKLFFSNDEWQMRFCFSAMEKRWKNLKIFSTLRVRKRVQKSSININQRISFKLKKKGLLGGKY